MKIWHPPKLFSFFPYFFDKILRYLILTNWKERKKVNVEKHSHRTHIHEYYELQVYMYTYILYLFTYLWRESVKTKTDLIYNKNTKLKRGNCKTHVYELSQENTIVIISKTFLFILH